MICWVTKMENPRKIMNELHVEKEYNVRKLHHK